MVSPNTPPPRPASPSPQPSSNDPRSQPLHSSSSSSDGSTRCADIPPTWPRARALNVRRAPAVAILPHCAPADHRLSELSLDISWRPDDNAACFRLHTHIWLVRASSGQSDGTRTPVLPSGSRVFIHISPESIVRLEIDRRPAETPFGRSTAAFKFTLSAPPGLVVPKTSTGTYTHRARKTSDEDEQNENSTSARRDQLLRRLAGSKMITVLAKVDQKSLPASQADLFCAALASGNMVADPHLADISSLYWGQGGEVINCSTLDPKSEVSPAPAYEYDSGDEAQLPRYSERNTSGADTPSGTFSPRPRYIPAFSRRTTHIHQYPAGTSGPVLPAAAPIVSPNPRP